jgi:hypothetical protein
MESKDLEFCGYKKNGISITVQHMPDRKKPCLAIQIEGDNAMYKVASFNSEETARWFLEIFEEFMENVKDK